MMLYHRAVYPILILISFLASAVAQAEPFPESELPPELSSWVPWVLHDAPKRECATVYAERVCTWPGKIVIDSNNQGGRFEYTLTADATADVPLPGSPQHWPLDVRYGAKDAVVLDVDERPFTRLAPGTHRLTGEFVWNELPEGIFIPTQTGLVSLVVDNREIGFPRREENGFLWLQQEGVSGDDDERLTLEVMRKISDGVPLEVTSHIVLRASGKAREIQLPSALIDGTFPTEVTTDIPATVDSDGTLKIQVRAGTHTIDIHAFSGSNPGTFALSERQSPWPTEEVWVWQANEALRQVALKGPQAIDPSRTNLPDDWKNLPAYQMKPGTVLRFETTRRGAVAPPPDQLQLSREIWMDQDGQGYTFRDSISGTLGGSQRLDLSPPGELGRVAVDAEPQLITTHASLGTSGVELRDSNLNLSAEWRLTTDSRKLPAVGWSEDVKQLDAKLHLPPGWMLLSARGVDDLGGTWWDSWDLWGFFLVLVVSLVVGRLTKWYFGLISLAALVLCYQEESAGEMIFALICMLAALGLLKVLPAGKVRIAALVWWWTSVLGLATVLIPFSVTQVRTGLFPQIGDSSMDYYDWVDDVQGQVQYSPSRSQDEMDESYFEKNANSEPESPIQAKQEMVAQEVDLPGSFNALEDKNHYGIKGPDDDRRRILKRKSGGAGSLGGKLGWRKKDSKQIQQALQQDPQSVVQTGPGVPTWRWKTWDLTWSGPVDKDHEIELLMISPSFNLFISILRVLLILGITLRIILEQSGSKIVPKKAKPVAKMPSNPPPAIVAMFVLLIPAWSQAAEIPDSDILDELRQRLLAPESCQPNCLTTESLSISTVNQSLSIEAIVHAGSTTSWPLPGPAKNWVPSSVDVDGKKSSALALLDDGFVHVRLSAGRHRITASGLLPPGDVISLEIGNQPHKAMVQAPGYVVEGVRDDGRAEQSIQLSKLAKDSSGSATPPMEGGTYQPWLEVTRTLDIGLPWLVHTTVRRITPTGSPILTKVPLIEGENVTESELEVDQNAVVLSMGRDEQEASWSSMLTETPDFSIRAAEGLPFSEVWILRCSPIWSCVVDGANPTTRKTAGRFEPVFRPWPGETVHLKLTRPSGVEGQSVTVDGAKLRLSPGVRLVEAELALEIRASTGSIQKITLPDEATIQAVTVDGNEQPYQQKGNVIEITIRPGPQEALIEWQQPGGIASKFKVPAVSLGRKAVNATVIIEMPHDRWLLWASGPSWGPAILFWGFLITVLLAGLVLGRIPLSPLKSWQWMLLALGLTQVPPQVSIILVCWFFVLAWRRQNPPKHFFWHNSLQIVIGIWTFVALGCLASAVYNGLAVQPDMQVQGAGSSNGTLVWYVDRITGQLPTPWVLSVPSLVWKMIMLGWSLWLAASVVSWAKWSWHSFSNQLMWRHMPQHKAGLKSETAPHQSETRSSGHDSENEVVQAIARAADSVKPPPPADDSQDPQDD